MVYHVIWALRIHVCAAVFVENVFSLGLGLISSGCGPSNSSARVECSDVYFSLFMSTVFTHMQMLLPVNNDSPKLVEMISIKVLILVWCLFWHRSLQELMVNFST